MLALQKLKKVIILPLTFFNMWQQHNKKMLLTITHI